jgi:hypothetical protein
MTTAPSDTTIHVPDNMPVDAKRAPQLGDTHTHFGGDPLPQVDATFPLELRPKGLDIEASAPEEAGLGGFFGGHATPNPLSPEKNILQTPEANGDGIPPVDGSTPPTLPVQTEASLSWTDGVNVAWFIRNEGEEVTHDFATYAEADAYFDANPRTRWLVPGEDEEPGWKAAQVADAPRDMNPAPGA